MLDSRILLQHRQNGQDGYSLAELIVVILFISAFLGAVHLNVMKASDYIDRQKTLVQMYRIMNAFIVNYHDTIETTVRGEYITSTHASQLYEVWQYIGNVPTAAKADGTEFRVYSRKAAAVLDEAGCSLLADESISTGGLTFPRLRYTCIDGFGLKIRFSASGSRGPVASAPLGSTTSPWNPTVHITLTLTSAGEDRSFGTSDDIQVVWSTENLDNYYYWKSREKLIKVARALSAYQREWMNYEVNVLNHTNSLMSIDDVRVPWELTAYSSNTLRGLYTHCRISSVSTCRPTLSCTCPNSAYWPGTFSSTDRSFNRDYVLNVLDNIGLRNVVRIVSPQDVNYFYDAFGIHIGIDPIGVYQRGITTVNAPRDNYTPPYPPPFITWIKTKWGMKVPVVSTN